MIAGNIQYNDELKKYKNLAKEALGVGDKVLHENYLQHSDHYSRILSEVNQKNTLNETSKIETNISRSKEIHFAKALAY